MFIGQCIHDITTSYGLPISLFLAGLFGGFTHCIGMCSPFVLAQTQSGQQISKLRSTLLIPYHLGRMTTYIGMAVILGYVLNLAFLFSDMKAYIAAPILIFAGILFLVTAFPKLSVIFPWVVHIKMTLPFAFLSKHTKKLTLNPNFFQKYLLGVLLGFMPCGLVLSAILVSATAPSIMQTALAMGAFSVGTIPALTLVAIGGKLVHLRYPKVTQRLSQSAMVISSIWLFILAGALFFRFDV